jgi:uncharacterized protein YbjT (DUF2867 family)
MSSQVLVTGASGTLGRRLVRRLTAAGHEVRGLSRSRQKPDDDLLTWYVGDLLAGTRLRAAADGAQVVVHCASAQQGDPQSALHLLQALRATRGADVHVVYISIVGVDRIPYGYYSRKLAVEGILEASRQPYTILRATQFHPLVLWGLGVQRRLPVLGIPRGFRFQPIDVDAVAERLVQHAEAGPAGRVPDLGGPEVLTVRELAETYRRVTGQRRPIVPIGVPGAVARAFRAGANLCEQRAEGSRTFAEFVAAVVARSGPTP